MRLDENIDFTTLTWVKPELDETLRQARTALQTYVEEGEDPAELRQCASLLHQVQGTLRMVELYGPAMVAEEMEQLTQALIASRVANRDGAYGALMQGIVQLPDYLERLQSGHRDIPIVLLPLLNELRSARGEKGLNESVLFSPDLSRPLPASAKGPDAEFPQAELRRRAETLHSLFQGALLRWLKEDNSAATIRDLTDVCEQLVPITRAEPARRLFWVAAGTLDALGRNAFPVSKPLKQALAKVEREIKRLAEGGDDAFRSDPPLELTKQLLYFIAQEGSDSGRVGEIRSVFGLTGVQPSEAELAHARGSLAGNNRALLETVSGAIKEDLMRVKDSLDLHLRTPGASPGDLIVQAEALDRVADTLGMLGLGVQRRVVQDQRTAINDVIAGQRRDDEETMLDIAGALLYVEAALDDQVERLGKEEGNAATAAMPTGESRKLLEVLVKEAIANFAQARQCFVAFVETHWDHGQLADVPRLLTEVSGALRILDLPVPSQYLVGIQRFTESELLRRRRVPSGQQMDSLADALASIEYYLEALRDRRPNREQIMEVARVGLEALGYWPLPAEDQSSAPLAEKAKPAEVVPTAAPAPMPVADTATAGEPSEAAVAVAATAGPVAHAPAAAAMPASASSDRFPLLPGFDAASNEEIDDEIRDVFLEELEEEIQNLGQLLPTWHAELESAEALRPIRRVFHTLKGSGRLVGAKALGEFSWSIESMLNRVLDGTRPATPAVAALVEHAYETLPLLRAALQGHSAHADLAGMQDVAARLMAGEEAIYQPAGEEAEATMATAEELAEAHEAEPTEAESVAIAEMMAEEIAETASDDTVFAIDPVLLEILKPEVNGHLETVDRWLAACAASGPQPVTDPLLRSIHTMNGAFAMTDVVVITDVTAPLEGYLKRALAHDQVPSSEDIVLIGEAAQAIRVTLFALEHAKSLPHFDDLATRISALRNTLPDSHLPSVPVHLDSEEAEEAMLPQAVTMGEADTSGLPEFAPVAEEAIAEEPIVEAPVAEEAIAEEPVAEEPVAEEAIAEEPVAEEPMIEAPVAEEAIAEAPIAEDLVAEEHPELSLDIADLPEGELLSLDDFLQAAGEQRPAFALEETLESTEFAEAEPVELAEVAEAEPTEELVSAQDDALAGMIAAFEPAEIEALGVEESYSEAEILEPEIVDAEPAEALALEPEVVEAEPVETETAEAEPAEAETAEVEMAVVGESEPAVVETQAPVVEDEFYGLSLEELEALTAPEAAPEAEEAAEAEAVAEAVAEGEAPAQSVAGEVPASAELSSAPQYVEALSVEAIAEMPEAEVPEQALAEAEAVANVEPESIPEPETEEVAAPEAEAEEDFGEEFEDETEAELAAAMAAEAEREPPVHAVRPTVPLAVDPEDPDADLDVSDIDPDLLDIFLEESNDILDHSDGLLAKLRDSSGDRELVTGLQRDLHTLKGGARMAGIFTVGELGHAMESLLEAVAEGRQQLDDVGVIVLERGFDRLHAMVGRITARKAVAMPSGLIAQVEALSTGRSLEGVEAPAEVSEDGTPAPAVVRPLQPLSAPIEDLAGEDEFAGVRATQEQVRIRADLLDRLVNYAGEVAIYRARLEQQLGAFRSNLGELNQTTTRLREQLRRLEIETEAQIVARFQREGETMDETFDPLELDRFSTQQQLSRALSESANDLVNLQGNLDEITRQYETLLLQQSRVSSDLQEGLMRTRMVPFDALVPRLRRVLRQAASDTGKQVQLKVDGASGEMDRNVLDRMTAPLEHMLRNSMAHGLELPADRRKAKKAEEGTVRIAVQREGSEVVLKVSDDGRGMDKKAIRAKAIERGLMKPDAELTDDELYGLVLETGFSTAETVSRLAGRGVGMDVVYSEIRQLGGTLQIKSEEGKGSEFIIRLPFTLAVTQAVFVKIGETSFAVPIASVQGVGRIDRKELAKQLSTDKPVFTYAGEEYAIHDIGRLIGHLPAKAQDSLQMPLLLARSGDLRTAICIDQVLGSREIVVKPVGPQVSSVPGIFGATIMGDGRVVVILDVAPLVRRQSALARDATPEAPLPELPVAPVQRIPVVMVVDDSITMRKVTGRVLERNNMEVLTAKDGVDAVEKMAERVPDLVLLDIEMPRMDGYEVAQNMRSDPRLKDVPIIMITSRTGEKHRQRAMEIGVDRYLGKPYQEPELMRNVFEMLGLEPVNG
jgi:chemosensory pili system protein ChpA (sensor histidine kinase/response regulator)